MTLPIGKVCCVPFGSPPVSAEPGGWPLGSRGGGAMGCSTRLSLASPVVAQYRVAHQNSRFKAELLLALRVSVKEMLR
jgi:hypothetical protein